MAERAHPDDPGFRDRWRFSFWHRFIPRLSRVKNPYRDEFIWRYSWANRYCRGMDVIDVPCGMGWGTSLIRDAKTLSGIDLNAEAVDEARNRYGGHAAFKVGDMSQLEFPDSSIDVVCCLEGIEHVPVEVGNLFLAEAFRVLRPAGRLLISSPYCTTLPHSGNPHHVHEYPPDEIIAAVSRYFLIEDMVSREVDIMTVFYMSCTRNADCGCSLEG